MADTFHCSLVTPERSVLEEEVKYASVPAHDGLEGIMRNHAPLLARLTHGVLSLVMADGGSKKFFVEGGFAQMAGNQLTILAERARPVEEIKAGEGEAAYEKAVALPGVTDREYQRRLDALDGARAMRGMKG